jgi:glutathione synthase/RimK-type ligase-like ATP-grasp enzyme
MIYVVSSKNLYAVERLLEEAKIMSRGVGSTFGSNYELRIMDLKSLISCRFRIPMLKGDVLYIRNPYLNGSPKYLPQIIKLAKKFKAKGGRVVDANITAGEIGKGKWEDYKQLKKAGLPIPRTTKIVDSEQWSVISKQKATDYPLRTTHYPLILKWVYGMKAKGTFLIKNQKQLKKILSDFAKASSDAHYQNHKNWAQEWLVQEYIPAKYEYKVICVGYKALPVVLRFKFNTQLGRVDFDSNFFLSLEGEGRVRGNSKIKKLIEVAERASKLLGRELSKVDLLEDQKGKFYVLEVNRFPGLKSFEQLTQYNVIKEFLNYLIFPNQHLPKE